MLIQVVLLMLAGVLLLTYLKRRNTRIVSKIGDSME